MSCPYTYLQHGNVTLRDLPKLETLKPLLPKKVAQRRQQTDDPAHMLTSDRHAINCLT